MAALKKSSILKITHRVAMRFKETILLDIVAELFDQTDIYVGLDESTADLFEHVIQCLDIRIVSFCDKRVAIKMLTALPPHL
jgi:hypothetical protein